MMYRKSQESDGVELPLTDLIYEVSQVSGNISDWVELPSDQCEHVAYTAINLKPHKGSKDEGLAYPRNKYDYNFIAS